MLVLPLGLGTKLRRWPIITLMIALAWVAVFVGDHSDDRMANGLAAIVNRSGVRETTRQLFVEYCTIHQGTSSSCKKYASLIWSGYPGGSKGKKDRVASLVDPTAQSAVQAMIGLGSLNAYSARTEQKRDEQLRTELQDCGTSKTCFKYKEMVWSFLSGNADAAAGGISKLPSYAEYRASQSIFLRAMQRLCAANDCLMPGQVTAKSLLLAQLRHAGLVHFLMNLLALLMFGIYVEQRGNRLSYFTAVVVSGTVGMGVYATFFNSADTAVIGGSAIVSAVMGMFYVFFFHSKMRFLVWLPRRIYAGTRFSADVRYCFPLFFLVSEAASGLDGGFSDLATHKVAHGAHLIAFVTGMLTAYLISRWRTVARPLIFEQEATTILDLQVTRNLSRVIRESLSLLSWNPENVAIREVACAAALRSRVLGLEDAPKSVRLAAHAFLVENLTTVCAVNARQGGFRFICHLLNRIPIWLPLGTYLDRLGSLNILKVGDFALEQAQAMLAIRLYDLYLMRFPLAAMSTVVEASAADAVARLSPSRQAISDIEAYLRNHPSSLLSTRLVAWLANNDRRSA